MSTPRGGFPEENFERLAQLEAGHYWFESRNRLIVWALRRYFPDTASFFDVGCGTGFVLRAIHAAYPGLRLIASDAAGPGLEIARSRVPSATFLQEDARQLHAVGVADVVGIFDVLEHIPEDEQVLRGLFEAVPPGGGVLITVPQHRWLWSRADAIACHVRRYRKAELVSRTRAAGFDVIRVTSFVSLLLPLLALSRWRDARRTAPFTYGEFDVPPVVNRLLTGALAIERGLIRMGVSWPAGGSLLVVARRPHHSSGRR